VIAEELISPLGGYAQNILSLGGTPKLSAIPPWSYGREEKLLAQRAGQLARERRV
jgi:hypothetical protein